MQRIGLLRSVIVLGLLFTAASVSQVAAQMASDGYMIDEAQFGNGASLEDCSENYCAKTSSGDLTVGRGSSANFSAQFGANTTDEPLLEVITQAGNQDLGVLDVGQTSVASSFIKVRSYLSNGYILQIAGSPPKMDSHTLEAMSALDTSQMGLEQFGINLVENTIPIVGADPVQQEFGAGVVESGYNTANAFKYIDGDIVAHSDASAGQTDYTMSMIFNISNVTPGGQYKGSLSAVVVPIY